MQRQNFASLIRVSCVPWLCLLVVMLGGLLKPEAAVQTVSFGPKIDFAVGGQPRSVAVRDFNGDGKLDLATANVSSDNVSIRLGTGTGSFGPKTDFTTGTQPASVAAGDFNGDGKLDLAVANGAGFSVSILLGTGTGSFGSKTDFATGITPISVAVGDFNGDAKLDLVIANVNSNNVSILLGTGTGSFFAKTDFATGIFPFSVAVSDFNGDGKLDLAVANGNNNNVSILLGTGTGSFGAKTDFATGITPISVEVRDFNGDAKLDLAVANLNGFSVSILLGTGTGSFSAKTDFGTSPDPRSVAVGDFDGDGKLDLAVGNDNSGSIVSILLGTGTGSFGARTDFGTGIFPVSVAVGDFNVDGKLDLATANLGSSTVSILLNTTSSCRVDTNNMFHQTDPEPEVPQLYFGGMQKDGCRTNNFGCALLTSSNMLRSFGGSFLSYTAKVLDTNLVMKGGYDPNCRLKFDRIPNAVGGLVQLVKGGEISKSFLDDFLDEHFCQNDERVIVKLTEFLNGSTEPHGSHFILVTGKKEDGDWQVFDPGWRNASPPEALKSLDGHFTGFTTSQVFRKFVFQEVRAFAKSSIADHRSLSITGLSPVELLVTDPQGRRLGYLDGTYTFDIPKGSYLRDFPLADDDGTGEGPGEATGVKTAYMAAPQEGMYHLEVTGTSSGMYMLEFRAVAMDGTEQEITISGMTRPGLISTYLIAYSSTPGAVVRVFDTFLQDDGNGIILNFNSTSGDYQFTRCSDGFTLNGRGQVIKRGCGVFLQDFSSNRRVVAQSDTCQQKGIASVQLLSLGTTYTIIDRNTANDTGTCP